MAMARSGRPDLPRPGKIAPVFQSRPKLQAPFPPEPKGAAGEGIAIIELFAGLRTARLADQCEHLKVVAHLSAELCPFANAVAKKKNFGDDDAKAGFLSAHVNNVNDIDEAVMV